MTDKMKYPIEAFALAMVLFSSGMKEAMLTGICLIFGDVLLGLFREYCGKRYGQTLGVIGAAAVCGAIYVMWTVAGITPEIRQVVGFAMIGLMLVKHSEDLEDKVDYNEALFGGACAYGIYVLIAAVREYLATAAIFGYELPKAAIVSSFYGKAAFALIAAGIAIAAVNAILKVSDSRNAAPLAAACVILVEVPFVWNNVPELAGMAIGILTVGVAYFTLRKKLVFADTNKSFSGLPVEFVMLGILYMVFGLL